MTAIAADVPQAPRTSPLVRAVIIIVVGILATTLAQENSLGRIPLQNLLKNELHTSRSDNAAFFFLAGLPWYFKIFAGLLIDAFPIFGSRRKIYLIASATLGAITLAAIWFTPHAYNALLWMFILVSVFMVVASTVTGAVLVETAQSVGASGRLTALRYSVQYLCAIIAGPAGGLLATVAFGWTTAACGGVLFLIVPVAMIFLHEKPVRLPSSEILQNAGAQLKRVATARTMWAAGGLVALFYIAPGYTTALFYRQQNELHMTTQGQGTLSMIMAVGAIAGAVLYGVVCRRFSLKILLMVCLSIATVTTLAYLFYSSASNARIIDGLHGFGASIATMALVDLTVRATPRGSEGLGYALLISIINFARFGTDWMGSFMLDSLHMPFSDLVVINAVTTLVTVPLVLLLPMAIIQAREGQPLIGPE